jgi:uncharacterized protein (TIGR03437 family)
VTLFGTGGGQTDPVGMTGEVMLSNSKNLALPVTATIGGVDAKVISAMTAPQSVTGVFQLKVQVPSTHRRDWCPPWLRLARHSATSDKPIGPLTGSSYGRGVLMAGTDARRRYEAP